MSTTYEKIKYNYIEITAPPTDRFGVCRFIDLKSFLPTYLQQTDIYDLVGFFEDYWNEMFEGTCGYRISTSGISETQP